MQIGNANRTARAAGILRLPAAVAATVVTFAALTLAACGGSDQAGSGGAAADGAARLKQPTSATLVLDFLPNAVHAGIYRAAAVGYYKANNIDLKIIQPTSTADTLKLIDAGKADFGIADAIDVATQIDAGRGAQAIAAIVQRPLGGLITRRSEGIDRAAALRGKTIGITGVPSDTAVLNTILKSGGLQPSAVKQVTVGFNGVRNLEGGSLDGFVGFYPADGVQVAYDGDPVNVLKFDESGGPRYPGLVVFSTLQRIDANAALMRAFVEATVKGYNDTLANPARSLNDLLAANPAIRRGITKAQLAAYMPLFKAGSKRYGLLDDATLSELSTFLVAQKLIKKPIAPTRLATNRFVEGAGG